MRDKFEEFRAQLAAWFSLNEWQGIEKVWRLRSEWKGCDLPEWVHAVLYIEEHEMFYLLNGYGSNDTDDYNAFEDLMLKCDVWWEMENSCVVWIYDTEVLDAHMNKESAANG